MKTDKQYKFYGNLNYIVGLTVGAILVTFNSSWLIMIGAGVSAGFLISLIMIAYEKANR